MHEKACLCVFVLFYFEGLSTFDLRIKINIKKSSMVRVSLILLTLHLFYFKAVSQNMVTGKVTDHQGEGIPGVTVMLESSNTGVVTDIDGNYSIDAPKDGRLIFSYVGYEKEVVEIQGRSVVEVVMKIDLEQLDEVIVTAFGIEKERKSLGFAQTSLAGTDLVQAKEVNLSSQLQGKVAGLQINRTSSGPTGSTNVLIRGISTLGGKNRPLIVVDGVPIADSDFGQAENFGGRDGGDVFSAINADDIESINVLKGAVAGVLYGERGASGVIIINTKKGSKKLNVEFNSNFNIEQVAFFPDFFQREYGQGWRGKKPEGLSSVLDQTQSWGARFDGKPTLFFDGKTRPYQAGPENDMLDFYRTGTTLSNTVSVSGGNDIATNRISVSNMTSRPVTPGSEYERNSLNALSTVRFGKKLTMEVKANYIQENTQGRPALSDWGTNPSKIFLSLPSNITVEMLKENIRDPQNLDKKASTIPWNLNQHVVNPFWDSEENIQTDVKKRLIGYALGRYMITDGVSIQLRYALDRNDVETLDVEQEGLEYVFRGTMRRGKTEFIDATLDAMLNVQKRFGNLGVNTNLGLSRNDRSSTSFIVQGKNFIQSDIYALNNFLENNGVQRGFSEQRTNGIYLTSLIDYNNLFFIDASVRNDWYSVLTNPQDIENSDNSALYGGVSASALVSDIFDLPELFSFWKLKGSYGSSGAGNIDPYQLNLQYALDLDQGFFESKSGSVVPYGTINLGSFPSPNLRPTRTRSFEVGTELGLFKNRVDLNVDYYIQNTIDQLLEASTSAFTGYASTLVNAGTIQNKGIEVVLNGTVMKRRSFKWTASINFTRNKNVFKELNERFGDEITLSDGPNWDGGTSPKTVARVGEPIAQIYGSDILKNQNGRIVHDTLGLPIIRDGEQLLGNPMPDFYGGVTNNFQYKNFNLSILVDYRFGNEIYSISNGTAMFQGKHVSTLDGRDDPFYKISGDGVNTEGNVNTTRIHLDRYYQHLANIHSENIQDASFVKLRQIVLSYSIPTNALSRLPFSQASLSIVGRNLFFLYNGMSDLGLDPESSFSSNVSTQAYEYAALPTTRSYGVNLTLKF